MSARSEAASDQIFVPGRWRCPKCKFVLNQFTLNANSGNVGYRDEPGEKCPNCDSPLWRVSWREDAMEMAQRCEEQLARALKAENEATVLRARLAELEARNASPLFNATGIQIGQCERPGCSAVHVALFDQRGVSRAQAILACEDIDKICGDLQLAKSRITGSYTNLGGLH